MPVDLTIGTVLLVAVGAIHAAMALTLVANLVYLARGRRQQNRTAQPSVSVLIPARNEEHNLRRLLPSLLRQHYADFEVIVYDDGSDDATWAVMQEYAATDDRIRPLQGSGPPAGWVGKVHALFQATRAAGKDRYLFLDADAELLHEDALAHLVAYHEALPERSVMTGLPHLRGGGQLLVSLVPNSMFVGLPWPLVKSFRLRALGALNGQCWMIRRALYHAYEPHRSLPGEVLEDVQIGRFLLSKGVVPYMRDVQRHLAVYMYTDLRDAWLGFSKNAYLILGGTPAAFAFFYTYYCLAFLGAPFLWIGFLASVYALKVATDRLGRFPLWLSLLAPVAYALGALIQFDSARRHWTGRVAWKGRTV